MKLKNIFPLSSIENYIVLNFYTSQIPKIDLFYKLEINSLEVLKINIILYIIAFCDKTLYSSK